MTTQTTISLEKLKMKKNIVPIVLIAALSFFLNFYAISNYGYSNEYYSAAVLSMTKSFKNFFFVSFDPSGMVSVDKPPLGLWIQAISALIFGYKGWALLLPQALASTGSCILIYILVKKYFSEISALISSFIFAITPIVVAVSRNNTIDMQLVFVLLIATWFLFKSIESSKPLYLIIAGIFIGLGFNIKMLQAYMIVPAFAIVYLIFAKQKFSKRLLTGIITTLVMLAVSLSWAVVVELYPASERPYVDSSSNNSVFQLIIGHNGTERILGRNNKSADHSKPDKNDEQEDKKDSQKPQDKSSSNQSHSSPVDDYIGDPSPFRLWIQNIYGQISWLIIMAGASIIACTKKIKNASMKDITFIFWEIWLFTIYIFFSFAGFYHRYYLCMMAPAIAILCGIGIPQMIKDFKERNSWRQFILPISFILTMILEINHLLKYEELPVVLKPIVFVSTAICILSMLLYFLKNKKENLLRIISVTLLTAILASPFYWALTPVIYVPSLVKPSAGPEIGTSDSKDINANTKGSNTVSNEDFSLQQYLVLNHKEGSFLVVSRRSSDIAKLIISTGIPCYAYGGFLGTDNTLTVDKLKEYVAEGKITYFLLSNEDFRGDSEITEYVKKYATLVDKSEYSNKFSTGLGNGKNNKLLYCFDNPLK